MRALPANVGSASGQPGTRLSCPDSGTELRRRARAGRSRTIPDGPHLRGAARSPPGAGGPDAPPDPRAQAALDPAATDPPVQVRGEHIRVAGVLLSGFGADGVSGLVEITRAGGISLVQDPAEARQSAMPRNAIAGDDVDGVLPLEEIAARLVALSVGKAFDEVRIGDEAALLPAVVRRVGGPPVRAPGRTGRQRRPALPRPSPCLPRGCSRPGPGGAPCRSASDGGRGSPGARRRSG
jgi:hypothetical protein